MARLNIERQNELQPVRIEYAINKLKELGIEPIFETDSLIKFFYKDAIISLYPYSGWYTGKSIKDGRGIDMLLKQLK